MPDVAFVNLGFPSGTIATSTWRGSLRRSCGRRSSSAHAKMVVYDDGSREPIRIHDSGAVLDNPETFGEYRLTYRTGSIHLAADRCERAPRDRASRLLPCDPEHVEPISSAQIGLDVVEMIEAVEQESVSRD